jgi:hypothetical protein
MESIAVSVEERRAAEEEEKVLLPPMLPVPVWLRSASVSSRVVLLTASWKGRAVPVWLRSASVSSRVVLLTASWKGGAGRELAASVLAASSLSEAPSSAASP